MWWKALDILVNVALIVAFVIAVTQPRRRP